MSLLNKSLYWFALLCFAMASCIGNEPVFEDSDDRDYTEKLATGKEYLALNILATNGSTRSDIGFKDGTDEESNVNEIRLYFFNASGAPAFVEESQSVWNGQAVPYKSYVDYLPQTQDKQNDSNIDRIITTVTTVIETSESHMDKIPHSVIAVINPVGLPEANLSLSELTGLLDDYSASKYIRPKNFIMSNAVYQDALGKEVNAVAIDSYLFNNAGDARDNPVDIYVERAVARLDLSVNMNPVSSGLPGVYDTGIKYEIINEASENIDYNGNICVKFLGWNFTSTPDKSRLVKKIETSWGPGLFGNTDNPWNLEYSKRSLWAVNPENVVYNYGNFGQALPSSNSSALPFEPSGNVANQRAFGAGKEKISSYIQENAAKVGNNGFGSTNNATKIIIAAQLVQDDGVTPITLVEWGFDHYTLKGIKTLFANTVGLYKKSKNSEGTEFTKITPDDLEFVTATALNPNLGNPQSKGRYYVYPRLKKDDNVEWALSEDKDSPTIEYQTANDLVKAFEEVEIWNSGYTYYYFDIRHLGELNFPGYYGVVRNHIYDTVIQSVKSLGTPVYDPNEVIYPEQPDNANSMLIAEIRILTWRLVSKVFKLQW